MGAHAVYDKDEAVKLYLSGLTAAKAGERLGVSGTSVERLLKKRGIDRRVRKLSPATELELCQRYTAGETATKLAADYSLSIASISRILQRNGFERREWSDIHRHHDCDHAFFSDIDSEEKAYWMGFIAADGYITKPQRGSPELRVSLAIKDEAHLVALKEALRSEHPIKHYDYSNVSNKNKPYVSFAIRSTQLTSDLARYGIVRAKCHTFLWPDLRANLMRHFLRGYFDGDGFWNVIRVTAKPHQKPRIAFRLTSDKVFLNGCQKYLTEIHGLPPKSLPHTYRNGAYSASTLIYGARDQARQLFHLMYDDATVYLLRKYERATPHIL